METRFELKIKRLSIKADDEFIYLSLSEDECMIKIAFVDLKAIARNLISQIQDTKRIG
ncbi:MAG TPA: hypothetical protein P5519_07925 [Spirochaetia bacterium]|jgi:hypothetical protein|nr:hypothetical protein [Spirochaetia bacterium]HRV27211.1 hypothetical protein [Spirochaetia bacterium]